MSVANAYAKALYQAANDAKLSVEQMNELEQQFDAFLTALTASKDAEHVLFGALVSAKEKKEIVSELSKKAGFSQLFSQFLSLLARKGRFSMIREIRESFATARLVSEGGIPGKLVAADSVNEADVEGLARAFSKKLGKRVVFRVSTDPSLLAGMKVTVNGITYDGTLRAQIQQLRDQFAQGFSE